MRVPIKLFVYLFAALFLNTLLSIELSAQDHLHSIHTHPEFERIDNQLQQGIITLDEAFTKKFSIAFTNYEISTNSDSYSEYIKCLVPLVRDYYSKREQLSDQTKQVIDHFLTPEISSDTQSHMSESGNFIFYYETEGSNAVPLTDSNNSGVPDYVEWAAFAADSSYRYQVEESGFVDFRKTDPYEIYFQNFNFYGTTTSSGSTSFIRIHNNFNGFPPNTHPEGDQIGALYVTIAHEIKHAIQYETNRWQGDAGSFDWIEMDATLMEEVVFPDVNDYYNYIKDDFESSAPNTRSLFQSPGSPTPGAYWHVSWMIYFYEEFGIDLWVDVWEQFIEERQKPFTDALSQSLSERGSSLSTEHLKNHMWHMTSGPAYSTSDFGFSDRENYPNPNYTGFLQSIPDSLQGFLLPFAAQYINATPSNVALGQPQFTLTANAPGVGIGVVGYFRDGSARTQFTLNPASLEQTIQTTWNWADLIDISIAVVNTNLDDNTNYQINIGSVIPNEDLIAQNFPNPFNASTNIEFSINQAKHVRVEVFDSIGRKVVTLADDQFNRGFHIINFDASGLASGLYMYRIITDQTSITKKMMLIK